MDPRVVFMDIDGTLMERGRVSQRVIDAIQAARARGHLFFVCTGRSRGHMPPLLLDAQYLDGHVMGCGMHCVMGDEVIHRECVPPEAVIAVAEHFLERGRECLFEGETRLLAIHSRISDFESFDDLDRFAAALTDSPVSKLTVPGAYRAEDAAFLARWFDVYDMGTYSDVVLKGVTKATGMQHVLDRLGLARENCIGVGDSANDLPMIQFAGLGVAMGNAPEHVKAQADAVTEDCQNDGVAVMIEKYLLND